MTDETTREWRERIRMLVESMPGDTDLARWRAALLLVLHHGGRQFGPGVTCQGAAVALARLAEREIAITVRQPDGSHDVFDATRGHLRAGPDGKVGRAEFAKQH